MSNYPRMLEILSLFSYSKLRYFLGNDLIDLYMTEWEDENGAQLTKKRIAEMIIKLNGIDILKNQDFRLEVLCHMDEKEIDNIYSLLPASKKRIAQSIREKALIISSVAWSKNEVTLLLLKYLGVTDYVFSYDKVDECIVEISHVHKRFYELLDYQFVIKQRILNVLNQPYELKRLLVHMPTGTGKTKTTMHTIVNYYNESIDKKGLVIWLAHTTELLQQAHDTFLNVWEHLGNGSINIYKVWGNRDTNIIGSNVDGIMFCGVQKLISISKTNLPLFNAIVKNTSLVVFDEAHKAAAKETRSIIEQIMIKAPDMNDRSLIGLTATPGRTTLSSDDNKLLSSMFEDRLIGIDVDILNKINMSDLEYVNQSKNDNVIKYFQNKKILAKIKKEQLTYSESFDDIEISKIKTSLTSNGYVDFSKGALELIGKNKSRNLSIMVKLRELAVAKIPTIVFACSVAHAKLLSLMLSVEDISNAVVLGDMNSIDRDVAISNFKNKEHPLNILINYEVLTTGFDATNIQCVFITRPTQSIVLYSQMLGRGLRGPKMGGNEECLLIDIKDNLGKYDADMAFTHFNDYWK